MSDDRTGPELPRRADDRRGPIVCATRGGEGSRAAREWAVRLATDSGQPLVFLFVVDVAATEASGPSAGGRALSEALRGELSWLGRVLLRIARQQAARAGVDADIAILEGDVQTEIAKFVHRRRASCLVVGAPRGTTADVLGDDRVERFAEEVRTATGVKVEIVRP